MARTEDQQGRGNQADGGDKAAKLMLTKTVWDSIHPVTLALGILYIIFAIGHWILLPTAIRLPIAGLAGVTAAIFFVLAVTIRRIPFSNALTYPIAFFIVALTTINSLFHLMQAQDILQTTNLMLVVFGVGYFILSTGWFVLSLALVLLGWGAYVLVAPPTGAEIHFGFALFSAVLVSAIFHILRTRALITNERLRLASETQQLALEQAVLETNHARETQTRFFNLSLDMLCVAGMDGYFQQISPAFKNTLGYTERELLDHPFLEYVHPEDKEITDQRVRSLAAKQDLIAFENRFLTKDGAYKWILWNATLVPDAGLIYAIGRDITAQKHHLLEVEEQEQRLRAILDTAAEGIITIDEKGHVQSFNPAAETIFGYREEQIIGQNVRVLMPEPHHSNHDGYLSAYIRTGEPKIIGIGREVEGRRKSGEIFPMALAVSEVALPDRQLFTGIVHDITARVQTDEALRAARARLDREIDLAAHIHTSMMHSDLPQFDGFEFGAMTLPARFLSGDFYDYSKVGANTCQVVLGDIAGKGIPAALFSLSTRASLRSDSAPEKSPATVLNVLNRSLYPNFNQAEVFVTLFAAQIHNESGKMIYASAGHGEVLLWRHREQQAYELHATGLPMGIFADETYTDREIYIHPGDIVLIFSDGVTDATDPEQEPFGLARLVALIRRYSSLSAPELSVEIANQVLLYGGAQDQDDDICVLVAKALPRHRTVTAPGTLASLEPLLDMVRESTIGFADDLAYDIELACSEVITNILKHAYRSQQGSVRLEVQLEMDRLTIDFYDQGESFEFDGSVPLPQQLGTPRDGGYGLTIVGQIADELSYEAGPEGNHWRLAKKCPYRNVR